MKFTCVFIVFLNSNYLKNKIVKTNFVDNTHNCYVLFLYGRIMKLLLISSFFIVFLIGFATIPHVFADTLYYYVEPLPDYASYANNVVELSTNAWENVNPTLEFMSVETWEQADFRIFWVKEFGVEHVGYALGNRFIEVGLGDSNCGDNSKWQPFSEKYITHIMAHEIGHILGKGHVDDPNNIMYPTTINWEYENIETSKTLTND